MKRLRELEADGLLTIGGDWITVTPKGRFLIRNICMAFDRYLGAERAIKLDRMRYSKTI
jgi:oxygen-independent coproporphyrinogen-3 oxidase